MYSRVNIDKMEQDYKPNIYLFYLTPSHWQHSYMPRQWFETATASGIACGHSAVLGEVYRLTHCHSAVRAVL